MQVLACTGVNDYHERTINRQISMFGLDSVSSNTVASRAGGQQVRLLASKRAAEQAEQTARSLRREADEAQKDADRTQAVARGLQGKADQAENRAGQLRQGVPVVEKQKLFAAPEAVVAPATSNPVTPRVLQASDAPSSGESLPATGVLNLSGQRLGQFINVAA